MNRDYDQSWIFFWAAPDPDYRVFLDYEREFKRKLLIRRALFNAITSEDDLEEPPQAG